MPKFFLLMGSFWPILGFRLSGFGEKILYKKEGFGNPPILLCFKAYPNEDFCFAYAGALGIFPFLAAPFGGIFGWHFSIFGLEMFWLQKRKF